MTGNQTSSAFNGGMGTAWTNSETFTFINHPRALEVAFNYCDFIVDHALSKLDADLTAGMVLLDESQVREREKKLIHLQTVSTLSSSFPLFIALIYLLRHPT